MPAKKKLSEKEKKCLEKKIRMQLFGINLPKIRPCSKKSIKRELRIFNKFLD